MELNSLEIKATSSAKGSSPLESLPNVEHQIKDEKNILYNFKIYKGDDTIHYCVNEIGDIYKTLYKKDLALQDFYNSNRIFRQYTSIEELFNLYIKSLKDSEIIINKNDNKIKISFILEFREQKDYIPFLLEPEKTKLEDIVMNLCQKVKELEIKLNEKDIIINDLKNKINLIENNANELNYQNKEMKTEIDFFKNPIDSKIIKKEELYLIEDGIRKQFNKNIKKYELLLRGSRDGFEAKTFHNKCDGKSFTVAFVETKDNRRFGGFTEETWDQSVSWKKGPNSFIFSLDRKEIYYIKQNKNSIYCYEDKTSHFLAFGDGHDFKLYDKCNINNSSYDKSGISYETNGQKYPLAGQKFFYAKDYEVYKIYI